jgi:molecular chaperone GrpE
MANKTKSKTDTSKNKTENHAVKNVKKQATKAATVNKEAEENKNLKEQLSESQDKYLRLSAEFDNYRRRTLKERADLIKSAGEDILVKILPVIDDFERGMLFMEKTEDTNSVKDGINLIFNKFRDFLNQNGIKEIPAMEADFDTDLHEAITKIPTPDKKMKGKIVDVVEKGYTLNDKVIRFAKVVIGE